MLLNELLQKLLQQVKTSPKLKSYTQLQAANWSNGCYELLATVLSDDLRANLTAQEAKQIGYSISGKTLSNLMKGEYRLRFPIDPRIINTLTKLAKFVGHSDWDTYVAKQAQPATLQTSDNAPSPKAAILNAINEAQFATFRLLYSIPDTQTLQPNVDTWFVNQGPAQRRLSEIVYDYTKQNMILHNAYNPSACEILQAEIVQQEDQTATVKVKEYWLLCWYCPTQERYTKRIKSIDDYYYVLKKVEDAWKIKTIATTTDFVEVS